MAWLALKRGATTLGELLFAPPHRRVPKSQPLPWYRTFWGAQSGLATALTTILGFQATGVSLVQLLDKDAFDHAMRLFAQLASPDWAILPRAISKVVESVLIAFVATIIAVPIAFVLSFMSAKNIMSGSRGAYGLYWLLRVLFNVSRSVEPILWAIIFSVWVGIGPYAGMLALMIHSVSSLAKQFSEIVECVEDGPIEGIQSTGAGSLQVIWFAVVPQIVLPYISYIIFRWDINVRMATIIGFVGGGGIGMMLLEYLGQAQWPQVGCIIFVITAVVWLMDAFSTYVREAIK